MGLTMSDLKWIHIWLNDIQVACPSFIVQQVIWKKKGRSVVLQINTAQQHWPFNDAGVPEAQLWKLVIRNDTYKLFLGKISFLCAHVFHETTNS